MATETDPARILRLLFPQERTELRATDMEVTPAGEALLRTLVAGTAMGYVGTDLQLTGGGLKIPQSGSALILGHNDWLLHGNPNVNSGSSAAGTLQVHGTGTSDSQMAFFRWSANATGPSYVFVKSRATTIGGTPSIVSAGDAVGIVAFAADDGVDQQTLLIRIRGLVDSTTGTAVAANRIPGRLTIEVASALSDDSIGNPRRFSFGSSGIFSVGTESPAVVTGVAAPGIEVSVGSGDATPVPAYVRVRSTTSGSAWSLTDPWAVVDFYSDDPTGFGAGVRARIGAIMGATSGSNTALGFWTAGGTVGAFAERWRITQNGAWQSNGAQTITTSTGDLTIATGAANGNILLDPHGSGVVLLGHTAAISLGTAVIVAPFQVSGTDQNTANISIIRWTNGTGGPLFQQAHSRGGSPGTYTALNGGDALGGHRWYGSDGVNLETEGARIAVLVENVGAVAANRMPSRFDIWTAAGLADDDIALKWSIMPGGQLESNGAQTIRASTGNLTLSSLAGDGSVVLTPHRAGVVQVAMTRTLTAGVADGYGLRMSPSYSGAFTVTRHNYFDVNNPVLAGGAAVTDAALLRFDAAAGTHKALAGASVKATPGSVDAWVKVNINGTLAYIPAYLSMTA